LPNSGSRPSQPPRPGSEFRRRRRVSFRSGAPYLVPVLVAGAAALAAWFWRAEILDAGSGLSLQSPENQIRQALAHQDRAHLEDVYGWKAGGTLELTSVRYSEVVPEVAEVVPDVGGGRATVVAHLDAEGRAVWRDQAAAVSYIGRERFHMKPCKIALWCAEGDQFARLRAVLRTLFRRLDAARVGDAAAQVALAADDYREGGTDRAGLAARLRGEAASPRPGLRVRAWQIRVDRDVAEVGEDYEEAGAGREAGREAGAREAGAGREGMPEGRPLRARYRLERRGERWVFAGGL
jgi:hypothetical protein